MTFAFVEQKDASVQNHVRYGIFASLDQYISMRELMRLIIPYKSSAQSPLAPAILFYGL